MARKSPEARKREALARIEEIKRRIGALDLVCSGTLVKRTKLCGKPGCRCATDPDARHGPYYEWGRMKGRKPVNRMVAPEQASRLRAAIAHYRVVRRLLRVWERHSVKIIEAETEPK
jgi:hypothetical protein